VRQSEPPRPKKQVVVVPSVPAEQAVDQVPVVVADPSGLEIVSTPDHAGG